MLRLGGPDWAMLQTADLICWCFVLKFSLTCRSQPNVVKAQYTRLCQRQHAEDDFPGSWQVYGVLKEILSWLATSCGNVRGRFTVFLFVHLTGAGAAAYSTDFLREHGHTRATLTVAFNSDCQAASVTISPENCCWACACSLRTGQ